MINALHGIVKPSGLFGAKYEAVLARATALGYGLPSSNGQIVGNALMEGLIADGVPMTGSNGFWVPGTDGSEGFATLNWVTPNAKPLVPRDSPVFVSKQGFQGNSGNGRVTTSVSGADIADGNVSYLAWLTAVSGTGYWLGDEVSTRTRSTIQNSGFHRVHRGSNLSTAFDMTGDGLKHAARQNTMQVELYNNLTTATRAEMSTGTDMADISFLKTVGVTGSAHTVGMCAILPYIGNLNAAVHARMVTYFASL